MFLFQQSMYHLGLLNPNLFSPKCVRCFLLKVQMFCPQDFAPVRQFLKTAAKSSVVLPWSVHILCLCRHHQMKLQHEAKMQLFPPSQSRKTLQSFPCFPKLFWKCSFDSLLDARYFTDKFIYKLINKDNKQQWIY